MKKKIVVGIVLTLVTIGMFAGCVEEEDDGGFTKEEVFELGEIYEKGDKWYDYCVITNHTNKTVFIYDVSKERITISNELQEGKWAYNYYGEGYRKDDYYPSIEYPELATEDYVGATVRIDYVKVIYYDDYYEGGVYKKHDSETLVYGYEIISFNHTYWQEYQSRKQDFYDIKDTIVNTTIRFSLNRIDKYGAGMFTRKSIHINHPHPDITVKLVAPEHFDNDIIFTYELLSPTVAILNATIYGTPPGRFKHGDYIVTLKYKLQSWHMYSNIRVIGNRDILVSL